MRTGLNGLLLVVLLLLSGCMAPKLSQDGLGGTGQQVVDGIGGTGQRVADGIGGTGIIGTITDFGSIWINNLHIHYDESVRIAVNGRSTKSDVFRLGQVVAVMSDPVNDGYRARYIDVVLEAVGPVSAIDLKNNRIHVLNQTVEIRNDTIVVTASGEGVKLESFSPGVLVEVSGLRRQDGTIVASRVDLVESIEQVQLVGKLFQGSLSGQPVRIGVEMDFDSDADRLLVTGHLQDGVLIADRITRDAILNIVEQATDLLLEGFLYDQVFDGDIVVGGIELVLPEELVIDLEIDFDQTIFIDAELGEDDLFYTEDFMILPEDAGEFIEPLPDPGEFLDEEIYDDYFIDEEIDQFFFEEEIIE
ncbi:MAG: DUF5666 domain-containing protein [Candidatus Thiodiazotropha taylori]|nr:DUF5666 domain-containing protein [Candidatus Thiodiazotropha taylori]MCG7969348.1 DUF5666 domain-containing protein [Candidatus Thiodiazotropha taylori]